MNKELNLLSGVAKMLILILINLISLCATFLTSTGSAEAVCHHQKSTHNHPSSSIHPSQAVARKVLLKSPISHRACQALSGKSTI